MTGMIRLDRLQFGTVRTLRYLPPLILFLLASCSPRPNVVSSQQQRYVLPAFEQAVVFDQRDYDDTRLYQSVAWAVAQDEVEPGPHWKYTCLATVYAMIEYARGHTGYRIGSANWTPVGVYAIAGTGPGPQYELELDSAEILSALASGNPVIVRGTSPRLGLGHYVLVVGTDGAGDLIAYDPWGGDEIRIDSRTWASSGSQAGSFTAISARRVTF